MSEVSTTAVISATNLSLAYGTQVLLNEATLAINEAERVGLLGRNGSGKSSFLRIVAGETQPDSGIVTRRGGVGIGFLPQVFDLDESATVHENILSGAQEILNLIAEYESSEPESKRSAELLDKITHAEGWQLEHRIRSLISNLHAPDEERVVGTLSGGEKRRVALCRALIARPDVLILDEPTNHLDTGSIEWLENFLMQYTGTCLFVTHDRYFLDRVATRIIELIRGSFVSYPGNYSDYLAAREAEIEQEDRLEKKRKKLISKELEWIRQGPKARRTKARDRINRFQALSNEAGIEKEVDVDLIIPPAPRLANRVIDLRNVTVKIGEKTLIDALDLTVEAGERIGIVGRNGCGKTTLLRVILGEQEVESGTVEIGARTRINYIDQGRLILDDEKTVFDEVGEGTEAVPLGKETVTLRSYLKRFLFTDERINSRISTLSGGERSRVVLAKILKRVGNVLILDEPTNDLDLNTLRVLEEALVAFRGSLLVVSHDRYFLNRVCTSIVAFDKQWGIEKFPGDYDYYLEKRAERIVEDAPKYSTKEKSSLPSDLPVTRDAGRIRKLKWKEERELESMEDRILEAESEVTRLEETFAAPDFYEKHGHEWKELEAQLESSRMTVERLYSRWEELERIRSNSESAG